MSAYDPTLRSGILLLVRRDFDRNRYQVRLSSVSRPPWEFLESLLGRFPAFLIERRSMKRLVTMLLALGLAAPFAIPTFAADETPKDQASCEEKGMVWDADMKICKPAE